MSKNKMLTSKELGELLLSLEERPIYDVKFLDYVHKMYSGITGVDKDSVEGAYVFIKDYCSNAQPNDIKYKIGDLKTTLDYKDQKRTIKVDLKSDEMYFLLNKKNCLSDFINESISFVKNEDDWCDVYYLDNEVQISLGDGFHPEFKTCTFEEAIVWYKENFPNVFEDGF